MKADFMPTAKWFCWKGIYRAEFETIDQAMAWQREHGGIVTDSPKRLAEPSLPTAGQIAAAEGAY